MVEVVGSKQKGFGGQIFGIFHSHAEQQAHAPLQDSAPDATAHSTVGSPFDSVLQAIERAFDRLAYSTIARRFPTFSGPLNQFWREGWEFGG